MPQSREDMHQLQTLDILLPRGILPLALDMPNRDMSNLDMPNLDMPSLPRMDITPCPSILLDLNLDTFLLGELQVQYKAHNFSHMAKILKVGGF